MEKKNSRTRPGRKRSARRTNLQDTLKRAVRPPELGDRDPLTVAHVVKGRPAGDGSTSWYVYAWRGGPQIKKVASAEKPLLGASERRAIAEHIEKSRAPRREDRTVRWLIQEWTGLGTAAEPSASWNRLAERTQKTWSSALKIINQKWGHVPLSVISDERMVEKIMDWRDSRQSTPRAADTGITVLSALLKFGLNKGVRRNTAANIPNLYRNGRRAEIIWTPDEIHRACRRAVDRGKPAVAFAIRLACETGLRRADLISLSDEHIQEYRILIRAKKESNGKRYWVAIPRFPQLDELLEEMRRFKEDLGLAATGPLLVNDAGEPWDEDSLSKAIASICDVENIYHVDPRTKKRMRKHLHDCRGTFVTRLIIDGGCSDAEAADIMGWSKEQVEIVRKLYVDDGARAMALGERIGRGLHRNDVVKQL